MSYVLSAVAIIALLALWWWRGRRRTAELRACAQKRQLRFSRQDVFDVHRRYGALAVMRVGHSRRAWNTFFGTHERGAWTAFFDCSDLGFGANRVGCFRCVAAMEMPAGLEALCVPADSASRRTDPLRTAIDYLSFMPADEACASGPRAASGADGPSAPRSHVLYVRRPSAAQNPLVGRLIRAIARYPNDCVWELGENVLVVARYVSPRARGDEVVASLLDAVAAVADELTAASEPTRSVR